MSITLLIFRMSWWDYTPQPQSYDFLYCKSIGLDKIADNFHNELLNARRDREIGCVDGKAERGAVQENGRNPDIVSTHSHNTMLHNRNGGMSGKEQWDKSCPCTNRQNRHIRKRLSPQIPCQCRKDIRQKNGKNQQLLPTRRCPVRTIILPLPINLWIYRFLAMLGVIGPVRRLTVKQWYLRAIYSLVWNISEILSFDAWYVLSAR